MSIFSNKQCITFMQLLKKDLLFYLKNNAKDNIINRICIINIVLIVYQFVLPKLGLMYTGDYTLATQVAHVLFFGLMDNSIGIIADIHGNKIISYDLTLPIKPILVFLKIALTTAIIVFLQSLIVLPIGLLFYGTVLSFPFFHLGKFLLITVVSALFSGAFSLFVISVTNGMHNLENTWVCILMPLSFFGCDSFTWKALHQANIYLSYLNLLNPVTYINEGLRNALLAPTYHNFSTPVCILMITGFAIVAGSIGIKRLKKQLDCM